MTFENPAADADPLPPAPEEHNAPLHPSFWDRLPLLWKRFWPELRIGLLVVVGCLLLGLVMGALWYWLAPEVPLVKSGDSVLYGDPEGEQSAGAVTVFVLLGVAFGLVSALVAFLLTRRRGGGIAVSVALGLGGVGGSLIAWWLGMRLGPTSNIVQHAKQAGDGHTFYENLQLNAHGAVLSWSIAAMVLLLALTATFGKREESPAVQWGPPLPPAMQGGAADPWAAPDAPAASEPPSADSPENGR